MGFIQSASVLMLDRNWRYWLHRCDSKVRRNPYPNTSIGNAITFLYLHLSGSDCVMLSSTTRVDAQTSRVIIISAVTDRLGMADLTTDVEYREFAENVKIARQLDIHCNCCTASSRCHNYLITHLSASLSRLPLSQSLVFNNSKVPSANGAQCRFNTTGLSSMKFSKWSRSFSIHGDWRSELA